MRITKTQVIFWLATSSVSFIIWYLLDCFVYWRIAPFNQGTRSCMVSSFVIGSFIVAFFEITKKKER